MKLIESESELKELAKSIIFFGQGNKLPYSMEAIIGSGIIFLLLSIVTLVLIYYYAVIIKEKKENGYYQNKGKSKGYKKDKRILIFAIIGSLVLTGIFANTFLTKTSYNNKVSNAVNEPNKVIKGKGYVVKTNKENTKFKINNIATSDKTDNRVAVDLENKKTHKAYRMYWIKNKNHDDEITVSTGKENESRKLKEGDGLSLKNNSKYFVVKKSGEPDELYLPIPKDA